MYCKIINIFNKLEKFNGEIEFSGNNLTRRSFLELLGLMSLQTVACSCFGYTKNRNKNIRIKVVGDVVLPSDYPVNFKKIPGRIFNKIFDFLQGADLLIGNLEGPITDYPYCRKDITKKGYYAFRYKTGSEKILKKAGFDILHIANNHILDFYKKGVQDTEKKLEKEKITVVGMKNNISYKQVKNVLIAFVGFNYSNNFNDLHDLSAAKKLILKAQRNADMVIVTMHAGAEGVNAQHVPKKEEIFYSEHRGNVYQFARKVVDFGADCVLGFSPHVLRGMEIYKNKLIAYSLGNFIGYGGVLSHKGVLGYSTILDIELSKQGDFVSGRVIPITFDNMGRPKYDNKKNSIKIINLLSSQDFPETGIQLNDKGELIKKNN